MSFGSSTVLSRRAESEKSFRPSKAGHALVVCYIKLPELLLHADLPLLRPVEVDVEDGDVFHLGPVCCLLVIELGVARRIRVDGAAAGPCGADEDVGRG